ncbi:MAG: NAD(P)-dependent oxidoreductase [Clostridiales bacterium]|nr:NAD(P)-dependent oxidoreductase [Clostridiales bacterium]
MFKNNKEDLLENKIEYTSLTLLSKKLNVGVIGSGKAGLIKAKSFISKGCNVSIIDNNKKAIEKSIIILGNGNNYNIDLKPYQKDFIYDKHIIIIAVNNKKLEETIKFHCNSLSKIYINTSDFTDGLAVLPMQVETEEILISINTKGGNPKGSMYIKEIIEKDINNYNEYIGFTTTVRNIIKIFPKIKDEVLSFIFSEDFKFFFHKGKGKEVFNIFYEEVLNEYYNCNKKK